VKYIRTYKKYKESLKIDLDFYNIDILESLDLIHDVILGSINAEEVSMFDTFKLPEKDYMNKMDIEFLSTDVEFINSLSSIALKKSPIQSSDDYECFINKPCKFMFIYGVESSELENPLYLLFESWNDSLNKWEDCKLYKVNDDVKRFYDKLSSKTIEITDGDERYVYVSSNSNEWVLQNSEKSNDAYKKVFRKEEMKDMLSQRKVKVSII
jgi:hypothetical protein